MNALVVYFSKFGNTRQVAEAVAEALHTAADARVLDAEQLSAADLDGIELLVMGTPTHKMNLPLALRPVLDSLPRHVLDGVAFAAFDTSYDMNWLLRQFTAAKRLGRKLRRLGGKQLVAPETFLVVDREGPLFEGEIERAGEWAATVLREYERLSMRH
jgi:flavodoxin